MKNTFLVLLLWLGLILQIQANDYTKKQVALLSWWDYIPANIKTELETACNTNIVLQEYYSNSEFFRRLDSTNWDVVIYSDNVYAKFRKKVPVSEFRLADHAKKKYVEAIKRVANQFDHDTGLFQLSITGFLYNPKTFSISKSDSIVDIFKRAKERTVLILDEHAEAFDLLRQAGLVNKSRNEAEIYKIKELMSGTYPIFSTTLGRIDLVDNFAFAYTWAGEAYTLKKKHRPDLKFVIHPTVSHFSNDLVTSISTDDISTCVAKKLISKDILRKVSENSLYHSPYEEYIDVGDEEINKEFAAFYNDMHAVRLPLVMKHGYFDRQQKHWDILKASLNPLNMVLE